MKKIFIFLLLAFSASAFAQPFNNSWIDYTKTYYKFKVGVSGLYRIPQSALTSINLGNTPAEQFQLWRNGEEVRLYTSASSGPLGSTGYIEFWGEKNDGKKDTKLYKNTDYQLSDYWSLETDTAAYFLTVNTAGNNLRFTNTANNVAGNILPAEPYFMNTKAVYYKEQINPGYAQSAGVYLYSSSYDMAEGYTSFDIYHTSSFGANFSGLNLYASGPAASLYVTAAGNAPNQRTVQAFVNNTKVIDENITAFNYIKKQVSVPLSAFTSTSSVTIPVKTVCTTFDQNNNCLTSTDRVVVSSIELKYPATFNFNNQTNFSFELPASPSGNYLVIDNFNYGTANPVLMDFTTGNRYNGDISLPGKVRFALPASASARKFILVNEEANNLTSVTSITQRNFINFSNVSNQANYIIISNPSLYNNGSGVNYVDQYRIYRSSAAGGSYNAKVFDIDQLTDQFAYGIKLHPASVKDFILFAKANFSVTPRFVFLIGKGSAYSEYAKFENTADANKLSLVPTFGYPASDILLASNYTGAVPVIPVGRLSVINPQEINVYLEKMKQYEAAQKSTTQTIAAKGWMKNVLHVIGGKDVNESNDFTNLMNRYRDIIADTLFGAKVTTFAKSSTSAVQIIANQQIEKLFQEGLSMIGYFGHSSANLLEFNLNNPEGYQNQGKYPFFNISGCTAGNNYIYDPARLTGAKTLSEEFVLADQRGSIAVLATTHFGLPFTLDAYNTLLYKYISTTQYGQPIGDILKNVNKNLNGDDPALDFYSRINMEQINLHGDPALTINSHPKPDYVIEDQLVKFTPNFISVAEEKFTIDIETRNIGMAIKDSVVLEVKRIFPDGTSATLYRSKIKAPYYADSIKLVVPVVPTRDKGLNKLIVTIDADNKVDEMSELNNSITREFYIYEDEAKPAYPYDYAIVNASNQKLYASTANPFSPVKQYVMEIDTTELFNSAAKISKTISSVGGLLEFDPGISYINERVYYWRVAIVPSSGEYHWNGSSFVYLQNSSLGANQSHYYQFKNNTYNGIVYNGTYDFEKQLVPVAASTANYPPNDFTNTTIFVGPNRVSNWGINYGTLQIVALDPRTLEPMPNQAINGAGLYGSNEPSGSRMNQFEFYFNDASDRNKIANFLNIIPDNYYVFIYNLLYTPNPYSYVDQWKTDGTNSLYNKLTGLGFSKLDQFTQNVPFLFVYKKNDGTFTPYQAIGNTIDEILKADFNLQQSKTFGTIESPLFGPAKAWKELHWRGTDLEPSKPDSVQIEVYGVTYSGVETKLATVAPAHDTSLAGISAVEYPFLKLKMLNSDTVNATPHQLNYWRINYDPAPEGALAPNILLTKKDTLDAGEKLNFSIAFKNISPAAFDSMLIKATILDRNNVLHVLQLPKAKPLVSGDTITLRYTVDTKDYLGMNTLYVDFNPDNNQPEQHHFNNFLYLNFFVKGDAYNPLLDVTFDGIHILNRDIVSAKPHITIKLKDESKYLALADTSLIKVQLRSPGSTVLRTIYFDNDTLRFTPANISGTNNVATVDYTPSLQGNDEEFELIVSAKDASGNKAGNNDYHVSFRVIDKPMISNLLNYPNPFTTSTAFVFTLTGSEVPQNLKIQILTVTGKVVREITKDELGPVHIGRNITDFKWDGTDTYGQKLANGVYLYRFISTLNGQTLEKFKDSGDNTDKYFTKGYGKMYLMR